MIDINKAFGIDAGINWSNGKAYFFKGNQYIRYDIAADKADSGYPLSIKGHWPGLEAFAVTTIKNPASGKVLDVAGGTASAGGTIWGYASNGSVAQKWTITPDGVIKSQLGDYALDLDLSKYQVVINPLSGAASQKWEITPNGVIKNKTNNFAVALSNQSGYDILIAYPIDESNPKGNEKFELVNL